MKKILFLLLLAIGSHTLFAQSIDFQKKSWADIVSEAQSSNKMIFVDAYTTWCGPCKQMDKKVFTESKVAEFFNAKFINAKVDMEKGEGPDLARQYDVAAYPTLLFIGGDGEIIHRGLGFHDKDQLLELAEVALGGTNTMGAMMKRYENGERDGAFLLELIEQNYQLQNGSHLPIAETFLNSNPDWSAADRLDFIYSLTTDTDSKLFDVLLKERKAFGERFGEEEVESKISDLIYKESDLDMEPSELAKLDGLFKKAYPKTAKKESANFRMAYFRQKGDRKNFGLAAKKYMKYNKAATASELIDLADTFYKVIEDPKLLKSAIKWAKKSVALAPKGYSFETLALLYEKAGKKEEAIETVKAGIAANKLVNEDSRSLDEMLGRMTSAN